MNTKTFLICFLFCCILSSFHSCSEETTEPLPPEPPALNSDKELISFSIVQQDPFGQLDILLTIDKQANQISISTPFDFDLTRVKVNPLVSPLAKSVPKWGDELDFRSPQKLKITAEDGTIKEFALALSRREQLPFAIQTEGEYASQYPSCEWGMGCPVVRAKNVLHYRTDENGDKVKHTVTLRHSVTDVVTVFPATIVAGNNSSGFSTWGLQISLPVEFPTGLYSVSASAAGQTAIAAAKLNVNYPCPLIEEQPAAFKVGDEITIKGNFFTNVPAGSATVPRVRIYKSTNLKEFLSPEFEIISFSATSITMKTKGFTEAEAYTLAAPTYLQIKCSTRSSFVWKWNTSVNVTP